MIYYFDRLSRFQEVILTDRALLYLIYKQAFPSQKDYDAFLTTLIRHIQQFFYNKNRQVQVSVV